VNWEAAIPEANELNSGGPSIQAILPAAFEPAGSAEQGVTVEIHAGGLPPSADAEMQRLYGNIHSTLAHLRIYGGIADVTHTYIARRRGFPLAVFLLSVDGDTVRVVNEGMTVDEDELERFAEEVFARWPRVRAISMHAVRSEVVRLRLPLQQYDCTANIVLPLPATVEEYVASLGKNMRRNLRRYMDKLKRDFPSMRHEVFEKDAANEQHIRDIIDLNRVRIAGKNQRYGLDPEVENVITLTRECGMAVVMTIDGRVAGGSVGYFAGDTYFFKVISHDPKYNDYSAGILCCYLTICECIARGCREYNFMWNEYEYKFALGAHVRSLQHLAVYRSRLHFLLTPRMAADNALNAFRRKASALLETAKPEELSKGELAAMRLLRGLRDAKRKVSGLLRRA
jgi:hypothetical protein